MPAKGTKTALPALRGKQTKPGGVCSSGAPDKPKLQQEVKRGAPEKPLYRTGDWGHAMVHRMVSSLRYADGGYLTSKAARDKNQGDKIFSLSDQSSWTSNEESDSETEKISSELGSELSSPGSEQGQSECDSIVSVRKKQKKKNAHSGSACRPHTSMATEDLHWDYTTTPLDDSTGMHPSFETQSGVISLETIYRSIMEQREESKAESHRIQLACRKMQMSICRVAKTCSEFATHMGRLRLEFPSWKTMPHSRER
ncbi:hypothetical protein NDU88_003800 [Pleurodeles waltl]|uniref:Uncharacterized protein n=1 Tax=Pleurodeles waltl TaxID=8319 RepID=A0AAV7RG87_PLEWA|nr:hypothetical protein NDU88_003800 [Pleurodeles waltl]